MKTRRGKRKPSDIPFARLNETLALEAEAPVGHSNPAQSASELDLSIREWLRSQIDYAEARLAGKPTTAFLSAYRRHGIEYVTCDLANDNDETHPITMVIAGQLDLCPGDPDLVDAVSAIQLAGRLLSHWSLNAKIGG